MDMQNVRRPVALLLGCFTLLWSVVSLAEPPMRAARLGFVSGTVSLSPVSQDDWVDAPVNRPLTTGDRLWADANSRAEMQIGGAAIRMGAATSVTLLNLDDRIAQVQLSQGALKLRVRHMAPDQSFEVDTPNLAFTVRRAGDYRIDVDANDNATTVTALSGEAELYGDGASYLVTPGQGYRFYGTGLSDYDTFATRRDDDLDRWARDRDHRIDISPSAAYVSQDVVGYEDLDANGSWRSDPTYGNVWIPNRVPASWTPYHDGHWAWVDPWGWTWVDDAPWGYAVSHYGRWANMNGSWGWVPGPRAEQATYAPALVAFVGGRDFRISLSVGSAVAGAVGWFPLAPREVYQPSYPVSRGYFDRINRSNAVIAPTTITNVYNTTIVNNTNVVKTVYVNQQVSGAVVAVPVQAFSHSQSVARSAVPLSKEAAMSAPVAHAAMVAPEPQSVHGGAPVARARPPATEAKVVAHTPPPPAPVPFAEQQKHLAANPGKPIEDAQRAQLQHTLERAPQAKVNVVAAAATPKPTTPPPVKAPAPRSAEARRADAARPGGAPGGPPSPQPKSAPERDEREKNGAGNLGGAKVDVTRAEAARAEAPKSDAAHVTGDRKENAREDAAKVNAAAKAAQDNVAKAEATRTEAARADGTKAEAARAEAAKAQAAKADAARAEQTKSELAKENAARAEAAKTEAASAQAGRAEAARAEQLRTQAAKENAARAEAAKAQAAREERSREEASRAQAARAEATRAEAARAAAARAEAARAAAANHGSAPKEHDPRNEDEKRKKADEEAHGR